MADLFTATKNWYRVLLLAKEFPFADSFWQRVFTPAGWKHFFEERRFLKSKEHQILTVSLALCSHRMGSRQDVKRSLEYITDAMELYPEFFREYETDSTVSDTLKFLEKNRASLAQQGASGSVEEGSFEVPFPESTALCSDNQCPCSNTIIPRGEGYIYISQEVVDNRRNARTESEAVQLAGRMRQELEKTTDAIVMMDFKNVLTPILMCEAGAKLRGINMKVAAEDARHWWKTGKVPLRPTPMASQTVEPSGQQADIARLISTLRTSSHVPELISAIEQLARFDDEIVPKVFMVSMLKLPKTAINALSGAQEQLKGRALQYRQKTKDTPMFGLLEEIRQELLAAKDSGRKDMDEFALLYASVFKG